jgi:chemotaxis protein methyltransferase WspC
MGQCGISDMHKYIELLQNSPAELDKLIEVITVPETWFFRMKDTFIFLDNYVKAEWLFGKKNRKLRILSMPCATGEEPYSIAMTLFECGLQSENFHIDAGDINSVCIERARQAVYTHYSFRGEKSEELIKRYFTKNKALFELKQQVKDAVHFFQKNILEYSIIDSGSKYDMVFCRNMLIYLDAENQQKAIAILNGVLREDGLLFLGHAESGILFNTKFVSVKEKGCFAFRIQEPAPPPSIIPIEKEKHSSHKHNHPDHHAHHHHEKKHEEHAASKHEHNKTEDVKTHHHKASTDNSLLQQAENSANAGTLKAAEKLCREYMEHNRLDEKAYFLMGMVLMASEKYIEAEVFFHKAVYIKPDYYDALLSIASIKEHNGDFDNARNLKERAKRIK